MKQIDRHHFYAISFLGILVILTIVAVIAIIYNPKTKADIELKVKKINTFPKARDYLPEYPVIEHTLPEV